MFRIQNDEWDRFVECNEGNIHFKKANNVKSAIHSTCSPDPTSLNVGIKDEQAINPQFLYVLLLEGDEPRKEWPWAERVLDRIIQFAQPSPAFTHAELLIPKRTIQEDCTFSTYIDRTANFGSQFGDVQGDFYLDPQGCKQSYQILHISH